MVECALHLEQGTLSISTMHEEPKKGDMQEFPTIRFRAAKPGEDASSGLEARSLVAQRVAVDLFERLSNLQRSGQLPASSNCDLVIFDR